MSRIVEAGSLRIGEGQPKICIPVVARNIEEIKKQAKAIMFTPADMIEWRVDHLMNVTNTDYVIMALSKLREQIEDKPVLVTFRSVREGGNADITDQQYIDLCKAVIDSGMADLIDIEYFFGYQITSQLIARARIRGVKVIMSNHDFQKTPSFTEMLDRLTAMKEAGADIAKIAVMPQKPEDVLRVMSVSERMKKDTDPIPVVTIAMGAMGISSRLNGEFFGSAITFASAGKSSAPGQIDADELDRVMCMIHDQITDEKFFSQEGRTYVADMESAKEFGKKFRKNRKSEPDKKNNIILVGFMGTGKSTVAKLISSKTGMELREIDDMVEEDAGMRITDIFAKYGESYFRDLETEQTKIVSESKGIIVSCGGGTVMRPENVKYLKTSGSIILLRAKADTILDRVKRGGTKRPLLNKYMSRGYISTLIKKRRDIYLAAADYVIDVDDKSSETVADMIIKLMGM